MFRDKIIKMCDFTFWGSPSVKEFVSGTSCERLSKWNTSLDIFFNPSINGLIIKEQTWRGILRVARERDCHYAVLSKLGKQLLLFARLSPKTLASRIHLIAPDKICTSFPPSTNPFDWQNKAIQGKCIRVFINICYKSLKTCYKTINFCFTNFSCFLY